MAKKRSWIVAVSYTVEGVNGPCVSLTEVKAASAGDAANAAAKKKVGKHQDMLVGQIGVWDHEGLPVYFDGDSVPGVEGFTN